MPISCANPGKIRQLLGQCLLSALVWLPLAGAVSGRPAPALAVVAQRNTELLLLDPAVQDRSVLLAGLRPGVEAILLRPDRDGLEQLAEVLQGRSGLTAIHLVSHGAPGRIYLGSSVIASRDLDRRRPSLNRITTALAAGGSLLIYGCDVAQGEQGRAFLHQLARTTGVAVAAASGPIGDARHGGSWALQEQVGVVRTASAFSAAARAAYAPRLGSTPLTLDFTSGTWSQAPDPVYGFFGPVNNFTTTYTQGGVTWGLSNFMAGFDPNYGVIDLHAIMPANASINYYSGVGYDSTSVTATLAAQGSPFSLEQLELQWAQFASYPTLRIDGYFKGSLVCSNTIPATNNYNYTTLNLSNGLAAFSGKQLDSIRITTNDGYNFKNIKVLLDTSIASLVPLTPSSGFANGPSVVYRATFGYGVTGLGTGNFDLSPTLSGASVLSVAPVAGTGNSTWDITVNTGTGDGPLGLRLVNSTNLSLPVTTSLPFAGPVFTLDRTLPAISLSTPSVASTWSGPVTYTVTYSDDNFSSSTLSAGQVVVNTTGTAVASGVSVSGSGLTRTITLASLSGSGTISISLPAGTAVDAAGNLAPAIGPSAAFTLSSLTSVALDSSLNPSSHGQGTILTATLSPASATGTVTFMDGTTSLGVGAISSGTATFTTSALSVGSHFLTAVYAGNGFYTGSTSLGVLQTVTQAATTLALGSTPNPTALGQAVTFNATGLPADATGPVTFMDGATPLGAGTVSAGSASFTATALSVGSHSITAAYGGDANHSASASSALTQVVNPAATTSTLTSSANPAGLGQTVVLTASGFPTGPMGATGTVTFKDGPATLGTGTLSSGSTSFSLAFLTVGSHTITAVYGGDGNNQGSTSNAVAQTVAQAATTTILSASPNPALLGQAVTFTAALSPSSATGTVTFKDGATTLGTASVNSGSASFSTSVLAVGSHSVTAVYGGDGNDTGSTSVAVTQLVTQAVTTTTLASSANPATLGQTVTLTASGLPAGATGMVTFKDGAATLGASAVSGGTASFSTTLLTVGSHTLSVVYGGDLNNLGSSSAGLTQTILQAPTTLGLGTSANPTTLGQTVLLSASGLPSGATGTVTFKDGAASLGIATVLSGSSTFSTALLGVGSHSLTAVYSGDSAYAASTSGGVALIVNQAGTTLTLGSSASPASLGQTVLLTASGLPAGATGTVTFKDGAATLGTSAVTGGAASFSIALLTVGSHPLSAVYGGDSHYVGSTAGGLTQVINQAGTTPTLGSSLNPATLGQTVTLTASGLPAGATGTVTFKEGAVTLGSAPVSTGTSAFSTRLLAVGSHTLTALYGGDGNYTGSTSTGLVQIVNQAVTAPTLGSSANPAILGQTVILSASGLPAGATGTVTFKDGAITLGNAPVSAGAATFETSLLAAGSHALTAAYGGDTQYAASASPVLTQTVGKGSVTVVLGSLSATYDGSPKAATATLTPANLPVSFTYDNVPAVPVKAGTYAVVATVSTPSYQGTASGKLIIARGTPALSWASPSAISRGTGLGATQLNAKCTLPGTFAYAPAAGAILPQGTGQTLSVTFTPADQENYLVVTQSVTIEVKASPQTLTFAPLPGCQLGDGPLLLSASASSGLPVAFTSSDPSVASISGAVVTLHATGSTLITASQPGDAEYAPAASIAQSLTVAISPVAPQVTLATLPDGGVSSALLLTVRGTAKSLNPLAWVLVNGASATLNADGTFLAAVRLRNGANPITVVVADAIGLSTTLSRTVTLDSTAPLLAVTEPSDGLITPARDLLVKGAVGPHLPPGAPSDPVLAVTVALNEGAEQSATLSGADFQLPVTLVDGWNHLTFTATTGAGRKSQLQRTLFTGAGGLTLAITDPPSDLITAFDRYLVKGKVAGEHGLPVLTLTVGDQTFTPQVVDGTFQQLVTLAAPGTWPVALVAVDPLQTTAQVERVFTRSNVLAAGSYTLADAEAAFRIAFGLESPTPASLLRFDLAPLVNGLPVGDGLIDVEDVLLVWASATGHPF